MVMEPAPSFKLYYYSRRYWKGRNKRDQLLKIGDLQGALSAKAVEKLSQIELSTGPGTVKTRVHPTTI